jgi:hypothetical protein
MSRNKLFAIAISEFLDRLPTNAVTERLNKVYSRRTAKVDSAVHGAQMKTLD